MSYSNYSDIAARGIIESAKQGKMIGAVSALPSASDCNGCTILFNGVFYYSNGTTWTEVAIHGMDTAEFKGTFDVVADLGLTTSATPAQVAAVLNARAFTPAPTNNDYCFVFYDYASDPGNINKYERYKFSATSWAYEFTLNNSSFTAEQWAAINSGITDSKVVTYDGYNAKISGLESEVETKQRKISSVSVKVPISGGVVRVDGMTDSALVWVSPAPSSMEAYSAAGCYCTEQATDSLTFTVKKDAEAEMTVNVAWAV